MKDGREKEKGKEREREREFKRNVYNVYNEQMYIKIIYNE